MSDDPGHDPDAPKPPGESPDIPQRPKAPSLSAKELLERMHTARLNPVKKSRFQLKRERTIAKLMKVPPDKITLTKTGAIEETRRTAREVIGSGTQNGADIVRFMINAMSGQVPGIRGRAQLAAAEWLGLYYYGKPVETTVQVAVNSQSTALPGLTDEALEAFARGLIRPQETDAEIVEEDLPPEDEHGED